MSSNGTVVIADSNSSSEKRNSRRNPKTPETAISWNFPAIIPRDSSPTPGAVTLSSPSLCTYGSNLYAAYREIDDSIWITMSTDAELWDQGCYQILKSSSSLFRRPSLDPISTLSRPSIASYGSYLWISWLNKSDGALGLAYSGDPTPPANKLSSTWTPSSNITTPTTPASGPSLCLYNSRMFLAYRDTNSNIYVASYGGSWNTFTAIKDSNSLNYVSADGPTLCAVANETVLSAGLWVAFRSVNALYIGKATFDTDGYTITGWTTSAVTLPCNVVDSPVLVQYGDNMYLAFQGSDGKICYACSTNAGSSWGDWSSISGNLIIGAPAMFKKSDVVAMLFQAFSVDPTKRYLMSTYHDFSLAKK